MSENFKKSMQKKAPSILTLKKTAQVRLTKNLPGHQLVNGSRGVVFDFTEPDGMPIVKFGNGIVIPVGPIDYEDSFNSFKMVRKQLPLRLGWATTIHKAQGCSLDRVVVKIENSFETGQAYVAISRATSLGGLWIQGNVTKKNIMVDGKVLDFY